MSKTKENRTKWIHIRCTENEYKVLEKKSSGFNSISDFIRKMIFGSEKIVIEPKALINSVTILSKEINKVGMNFNQLARYVNFAEKKGLASDENIQSIRDELIKFNLEFDDVCFKINNLNKK